MSIERVIGRYTGEEKGPLLICFGGMHGNEPAGIHALELMFRMLEVEPIINPEFNFKGRIVGLRGNLQAIQEGRRFIKKDLNRHFTPENVKRVLNTPLEDLVAEDRELKELIELIDQEMGSYQPEKMVFLDLHTTTAFGGIFSIATDDPESIKIAIELHAPVITRMLKGIKGTTLHYFCNDNFESETIAVTFESGQHNEQLSVNRAIAALTNCMRTMGCVRMEDVENRHDALLIEFSKDLPKVAELIMCHSVAPEDNFQMQPNYKNFQKVRKGEWLATDNKRAITAQEDGLILMPLYQKQGEDGFFLIKTLKGY